MNYQDIVHQIRGAILDSLKGSTRSQGIQKLTTMSLALQAIGPSPGELYEVKVYESFTQKRPLDIEREVRLWRDAYSQMPPEMLLAYSDAVNSILERVGVKRFQCDGHDEKFDS